ncbi:Bug family tripartite tricarboxylate transporter substrate binding protein [Paraburkholderia sp. ZP32-5]|uniref:Bug family tripartite tricarboxylate transporter substrate binding protein n=1 Tax=Paraburkholderia sp. ZP32-5 TaxID=2883245 RepID=UPI001F1A43C3|nr:tripartite tricarboxylate transporter substrate binding protein [Paraburkholderia sp. ZP32-5]
MFKRFAVGLAAGLSIAIVPAQADSAYPTAPIRLIVGQSAGSSVDAVARIMSERMSQSLGQAIVVENRPGANGVTATAYVAKARPDGYTLLFSGCSPMVFNPGLYKKLPYDPVKDFTYIAAVSENPFVMVASKASGLKSFADLTKEAKANPGKFTFASAGIGNSTQLATELVAQRANFKLLHIPFSGSGPALVAVIGGQVDLMSSVVGPALPELKAGAATPLLIIGGDPIPELPGVPGAKQIGLDLPSLPTWTAVVGPAGLDPAVAKRLEQAVQEALQDPKVQKQFKTQYLSAMNVPGPQMAARVATEIKLWKTLLHDFGIKPE